MASVANNKWGELLSMEARIAAIYAKEGDLLNVLTMAASYTLASGEMAPTDPEFKAMIAKGETTGLAILHQLESSPDMVDEYGGGEEMAAVLRRKEAAATALKARAEEFVGFMRDMAALIELEEEEAAAERQRPVKRARRPNAKYFGPEWKN
jgi:hypothetical protein